MSHLLCLRAAAAIHHHARNLSVDDLLLVVKVEHINGWHFGWCTARTGRASRISVLHQMGVWVLLHEHVLTLAWTVVGFVALRSNDPIPSKCLKVHCEWVAAASRFGRVLITVQAKITAWTFCRLENFHLQERLLEIRGGKVSGKKWREGWNFERQKIAKTLVFIFRLYLYLEILSNWVCKASSSLHQGIKRQVKTWIWWIAQATNWWLDTYRFQSFNASAPLPQEPLLSLTAARDQMPNM